jgi:pimeloyl-ACP methyl ester carboxylesterase
MGNGEEIRAAGRVVGDALAGVVGAVRDVHAAIADRSFSAAGPAARPVQAVHDVIAGGIYAAVRGAHFVLPRVVSTAAAYGLPPDRAPLSERRSGRLALAVVNGLWGDTLSGQYPGLATTMAVRSRSADVPLTAEALRAAFPGATPRIALFVHGLCETEEYWSLSSRRHYGADRTTLGSRLRRDLGYTPVYLRYNTGLHVSDNGMRLAGLLDGLVAGWPVPVEEVTLVGHSMGGLVIRSAGQHAATGSHPWVSLVRHVVCLGTPHLGAPLEKGVHAAAWLLARFPETRPAARLLSLRSVGVKDLAFGALVEEDWRDADPDELLRDRCTEVPFLPHAAHYFIGATVTRSRDNPFATVVGDLFVRFPSASGSGRLRHIPFESDNGRHLGGLHHFDLLNHPEVHEQLCAWLARADPTPRSGH